MSKTITLPLTEYEQLIAVETRCAQQLKSMRKDICVMEDIVREVETNNSIGILITKERRYGKTSHRTIWNTEHEAIFRIQEFIGKMTLKEFLKLRKTIKRENK